MGLKGHVDKVNKFLIAGWALSEEDLSYKVAVNIIQNGDVIFSLVPRFEAPTLLAVLGLPPSNAGSLFAWRIWMPVASGIELDTPFTIVFAETGEPLAMGVDRVVKRYEDCHPGALKDLQESTFIYPWMTKSENAIHMWLNAEYPAGSAECTLSVLGRTERGKVTERGEYGKDICRFDFVITKEALLADSNHLPRVALIRDGAEVGAFQQVFTPKSIFSNSELISPLPELKNIFRVSGQMSDQIQYLVGGATTFMQMNALVTKHCGKAITEFETVVDWGVGCARVARHFWESAVQADLPRNSSLRLFGLDIDEINVRWCRENMGDHGSYGLLSLDGFDLRSSSVDILYGISVLTHLTEHHQHVWLAEIQRVLRPGGLGILTIHGEGIYYRQPAALMMPFAEKFGFFDGIADDGIGSDRDTYYRVACHSRKYIREEWGKYFEILDIIPMGNAFRQDFVVVRRK